MIEVLKAGAFETVVFSAMGVREGYLFGLLDTAERDLSDNGDGRSVACEIECVCECTLTS